MTIKRPHITEKTVKLAEDNNQYTFEVSLKADKISASKELNDMFGVEVESVQTLTRLGRPKKVGKNRIQTRRRNKKFMVFKLKKGDKIDIFTTK